MAKRKRKQAAKKRKRKRKSIPQKASTIFECYEFSSSSAEGWEREELFRPKTGPPTDAIPGSEEKIRIMRERLSRGLNVHEPGDATWAERSDRIKYERDAIRDCERKFQQHASKMDKKQWP